MSAADAVAWAAAAAILVLGATAAWAIIGCMQAIRGHAAGLRRETDEAIAATRLAHDAARTMMRAAVDAQRGMPVVTEAQRAAARTLGLNIGEGTDK